MPGRAYPNVGCHFDAIEPDLDLITGDNIDRPLVGRRFDGLDVAC